MDAAADAIDSPRVRPRMMRSPAPFRFFVATGFLALLPTTRALSLAGNTTKPRDVLRVATLNMAHGRGLAKSQFGLDREVFEKNIDAIGALLKRELPDVVALQEADQPSAWSGSFDHVARASRVSGHAHVFHGIHFHAEVLGVGVRYGTALISRRALASPASYRFAPPPLHTKGFVTARVTLEEKPLLVASLHLDSASASNRRRQVDRMVSVLNGSAEPIVLMGDFNSRWANKTDAVRQLADRLHLLAYQPDRLDLNTFPAERPRKRIDWILISPSLEFVSYHVWEDTVSDHRGVAAEIRWKSMGSPHSKRDESEN